MARLPAQNPGNGTGGGGETDPSDDSDDADDETADTRPTGIARPDDTPEPAPDTDDGGGGGGGSETRPTGIADPEDTPGDGTDVPRRRGGTTDGGRTGRDQPADDDPAPDPAPPADRPTGPTAPDQTPGPGDSPVPESPSPPDTDAGSAIAEGVVADETRDLGDTPIGNPLTDQRLEEDLRDVAEGSASAAEGVRTGPIGTGAALLGERLYPESEFGQLATRRATTAVPAAVANFPGDVAATAGAGKEAAETAAYVPFGGPGGETGERAIEAGQQAARAGVMGATGLATAARRRPLQTGVSALLGVGAGGATGRGAGVAARSIRDRVRTRGATRVDPEDLTQEDVVRFQETGGREGTRFPGADDPDLYRSDPPEAVRRQADERTPEEIQAQFEAEGVEGTDLKKALDVEPDEPEGFTTQEGTYESPGSFFGPELSPNFLRVGGRGSTSFRPGLPDLGGRPTGVIARTDVRRAEADDLEGFNRELLEARGETTARTKPASEVSTGEIEAVVPPGARFRPVGSPGGDFYTEIGGRRVPIRTVAPEGDADAPRRRGGVGDDDTDGPATDRGATLEDLSEPLRDPEDRGVPVTPSSPSPTGSGGSGSPISDIITPPRPRDVDEAPSPILPGSGGSPDTGGDRTPGGTVSGGSPSAPGDVPSPVAPPFGPPSDGPPSGGGGSGSSPAPSPGAPGSPGGSPAAPPSPPTDPTRRRRPDIDLDDDRRREDETAALLGLRGETTFAFINPLTGEQV